MADSKPTVAVGSDTTGVIEATRKSAIRGAFFSEFVDMFDVFLPVAVLSPVLFFFQPPHLSEAAQVIQTSLVFITTLLGRPIGAWVFGMIADRVGRRKAAIQSTLGFAVATLLIALLPGYATLGGASYMLLVLLRFVDGIFLGGGYAGAIPLAMEYARKRQRGVVGGVILAGFPAAFLVANLLTMLMFAIFPLAGADSPYARWGWRIPFVIGALLAVGLCLYYVFKVKESEVWQQETGQDTGPGRFSALLGGSGAYALFQVFVLMSGFWLTQNIISLFLPSGLLAGRLHLDHFQVSSTLVLTYAVLIFSYIGAGMLSQRIGRRRFFVAVGCLIATVGVALYCVLATADGLSLSMIRLLVCLLAVLVTSPWGVVVTYINERFATEVRATGFGISFSFSMLAPSFYAFYLNGLGHFMPPALAPAVLLAVGGLIGMLGALIGPETKDVDF